ncbi:MAG: helix-turn-helix transcriptional regulator, partial [Acidobacteriota bacterium]
MSLTLGEKLRQAREDKGFSLSEVADQTRISSLYLESIENDDYKILPGGIFNKGFVKSYAKFVGVDEQEALADYSRLISGSAGGDQQELKVYRPEVLTDDRSGASMAPTIIIAVIILALMTGGILFLVDYLRQPASPTVANTASKTNVNPANTPANTETAPAGVPDMAALKVEFKALSEPVSLSATADGKMSTNVVTAGSTVAF